MAKTIRVSDAAHLALKRWAVETGCSVGSLVEGYASRLGAEPPPHTEYVGGASMLLVPSAVTEQAISAPTLETLRAKAYAGPFSKASQMGKK